jgi:hypothetical protein
MNFLVLSVVPIIYVNKLFLMLNETAYSITFKALIILGSFTMGNLNRVMNMSTKKMLANSNTK